MLTKLLTLYLTICVTLGDSLRILVVFPMTSKSHSILGHGVVNNLLDAGHEVVHITSFPREKPPPKLKEIELTNLASEFRKQAQKTDDFKLKNLVGKGNMGDSVFFNYFIYEFHKMFLNDETFIKFLSDPSEKFDAVVAEWFFSEIPAGIAAVLKCPLIWFGSTEAHWQVLRLVDEIPSPSYAVDLFSTSTPPLSFWDRTAQLWRMLKKYFLVDFVLAPLESSNYNSVFPKIAAARGVEIPSYYDAVYNGSLLLLNSHPSIGTPFRLPQSAKYVAGYHIDKKIKPLPENLQKLMDGAKNGVIYFSMGSNVKSADMSDSMKASLLKVFGKLKQIVIWKFEEDLNNVPANVHLVKWAPQTSILPHPNLKFFITHGGQLSTTEAIHFGVPVIGIPVLGDQHVNMNSVEHKGFGIKLNLAEDLAEHLEVAIAQMLGNPSYRTKAKELSRIFHDRIMPPSEEVPYWVEHVVRTGGAPHLRSPAILVPWYQKVYLDLLLVVLLVIASLSLGIRVLCKTCRCKRNEKIVKKKKH